MRRRRLACLAAAVVLLGNCGCLLVAAGAGAAAGGAGYAYYKGNVCRDYPARFDDVWAAVQSALPELGMPVESIGRNGDAGTVLSRSPDGDPVRVSVESQPGRAAAEGVITRVCVRVATFGDQAFSRRFLDQVGYHLVPATTGAPAQPPVTLSPPTPLPPQTEPPPLLPPEPVPSPSSR